MLEEAHGAAGTIGLMEESGALMSGHFELASGLHSEKYIQCALLLEDPVRAEQVGRNLATLLAATIGDAGSPVVVSPALGGVIIGHEVARALGTRHIFVERAGGKMSLRRGFQISKGEKAVVVEDVTTTGGSIGEVIEVLTGKGAEVVAVGLIVNRAGDLPFDVPVVHLVSAQIENHEPAQCPMCKDGVRVVKPGTKRTQMEAGK
jgi:orotate phosphoribosyltransferase